MQKKYKRGDVRDDGMVFRNYTCRGEEWWVTTEAFADFKEADKRRASEYRARHPDRVKQSNKKWNLKNPGVCAAIAKKWRQNNREYVNQVSRDWQRNHPEKVKEMNRKRFEKDPDGFRSMKRMHRAKRRAALEERLHPDHNFEIEKILSEQCKRLYDRFRVKFEIDHIVPLNKGGWHHHLNLHVIPMVWNRRKHTKDTSVIPDCWSDR